jgi:F5/8 type C domain
MRAARSGLFVPSDAYERAVAQTRLLVEVAHRVAEPVEALPKGCRPAALCSLYRDAVYFALVAERTGRGIGRAIEPDAASDRGEHSQQQPGQDPGQQAGSDPRRSLQELWAAASPAKLLQAAGDEATLRSVHDVLVNRSMAAATETTEQEAASVRKFVESLLWELDAPIRAVERVQLQRWTRVTLLAGVCLVAVFGGQALLRGPNLASEKRFKTSSSYAPCTAPNKCADVLLHTLQEQNPWADFDLGAVKTVRRVEITNRSDCCPERSIPLIVELSPDDKTWTQVARRDKDFATWVAKFPKRRARYVRLRVTGLQILNLDDVIVR